MPNSNGWPLQTGQDFLPNHQLDGIDYASIHLWPDNWCALLFPPLFSKLYSCRISVARQLVCTHIWDLPVTHTHNLVPARALHSAPCHQGSQKCTAHSESIHRVLRMGDIRQDEWRSMGIKGMDLQVACACTACTLPSRQPLHPAHSD